MSSTIFPMAMVFPSSRRVNLQYRTDDWLIRWKYTKRRVGEGEGQSENGGMDHVH